MDDDRLETTACDVPERPGRQTEQPDTVTGTLQRLDEVSELTSADLEEDEAAYQQMIHQYLSRLLGKSSTGDDGASVQEPAGAEEPCA